MKAKNVVFIISDEHQAVKRVRRAARQSMFGVLTIGWATHDRARA